MSLRNRERPAPAVATAPAAAADIAIEPTSAFAVPQFRWLFAGNAATMMGFGMMQVANGYLAFDLTQKNSAVGFVAMAMGLPMLFLGPLGGALSDRMSKRMLLLFGQSIVGSVFFFIGLFAVLGVITIWMLAGLTLVLGCSLATLMPARQAWLGDLLRGPALANGVALQQLAMNATRILGPLLAGGLIAMALTGIGGTYMVMAACFFAAVVLLAFMEPTRSRGGSGHTSVFGDLREGLGYMWRNEPVRLLLMLFTGVVLSAFSYQQLMPGFLENQLDTDKKWVGAIFGTTAMGGIILTLFMTGRMGTNPARLMYVFGAALAVALVLLAISPTFVVALATASLVGASSSGFQMCNQVSLMQLTDSAYFGRVMSLTMTAFGMQMVVGFPVGALADAAGERAALVVLAAASILVVGATFLGGRTLGEPGPGDEAVRA